MVEFILSNENAKFKMYNLNYFVTHSGRSRDPNLVATHYLRTPGILHRALGNNHSA